MRFLRAQFVDQIEQAIFQIVALTACFAIVLARRLFYPLLHKPLAVWR